MDNTYQQKTWHRQLLEHLLQKNSHLMNGRILDIGSKNRRYDYLFQGKVTAIDLMADTSKNIAFGDIERGLAYPDESFDSILCLEVFEYLENYPKAISEIHRLLKMGGRAIITTPFMYHEHGDKLRFTKTFLADQFKQFASVEIKTIGNAYTTIWDILRKKWFLNRKKWSARLVWLLVLFPLWNILKPLKEVRDDYYSGVFIILQK